MAQLDPAQISETTFDVVVIGAGINGAGIARDAAMRGLSVLLIDKGDIGQGTTSFSTRLIHGGLRYLEHGELGLVYESLRERETLFRVAPHLLKSLPILIPIYEDAKRGKGTVRAGMIAYDLFSLGKSLPRHRMLSREEALNRVPALCSERLAAGAIYYDAQVEFAERLVVENVLSAQEHGAVMLTHHDVCGFVESNGVLRGLEVRNVLTGTDLTVQAKIIVNASGPWVDRVLEKTTRPSSRLIGGTKGSHLIVATLPGAPAIALYVEAKADQRPFFVIPWNDKYLIGTTDIRFEGDPDDARIDDHEIDYLLNETNRLIPKARLDRESILFSYCGVRPLAFSANPDEQSITRRHFVREHPFHHTLISIVGGKLTTYRTLSEQAVNVIAKKLGRSVSSSMTASRALPGAQAPNFGEFSKDFINDSRLPAYTNKRLLRIYGTRASEVLRLASQDARLVEVFDDETGAIAAEIVFAFEHEFAQTLADCLLRRTMVGFNTRLGVGADEAASRVAERFLGWSEERCRSEVQSYRTYIKRFQVPKRE